MIGLLLVVSAGLLCFGGLLGASWTTQIMGKVSRRHATERRELNQGWRELAAARRAGDAVLCPQCDDQLTGSGWLLVIEEEDDEDDGT